MRRKNSKFLRGVLVFLIAVLILSSAYQVFASAGELKKYPAPRRLIDVGGHRLHIFCIGQGEPTIVMEAGMAGWSTDWVLVQPEVTKVT